MVVKACVGGVAAASMALAALVGAAPAGAASTRAVVINSFAFGPRVVTVAQGTTVRWTQQDPGVQHTSTSDQGFWSSAPLSTGQSYSQLAAFESAGSYSYHCAIHPDMTGQVRVLLAASGSAARGWTVRWSRLRTAPAGRAYDVQVKAPGAKAWKAFRTRTTRPAAFVHPRRAGHYLFRARTENLTGHRVSGWSPARSVPIG